MRFSLAFLSSVLLACAACASSTEPTGATTDDVHGAKVLLDCNVFEGGGGPDQQVTVEERKDGLVIRELTNHGAWIERALSTEEWKSGELTLRKDTFDGPDAVNRLYKIEDGYWMNESKGGGWRTLGYADCR